MNSKDLKVRHETIKLIEENIGNTLFDIGHKGIFLDDMPTQIKETKGKISKWDFIRLKSFSTRQTKPESR